MSKRKGPMSVKRPEWLDEYSKRTRIIDVIAMAFDPNESDKAVRKALIEAAKELGDVFMPPTGG